MKKRIVLICFTLMIVFSLLIPAKNVSAAELSPLPEITLVPPPNALYAYLYGTPVYNVPQDKLHVAVFQLSETHFLNLWNFYYAPGTKASVIGQDTTGYFLLVLIKDSGQVGWIPLNQVAHPETLPFLKIKIFYHENMPNLGVISLPLQ